MVQPYSFCASKLPIKYVFEGIIGCTFSQSLGYHIYMYTVNQYTCVVDLRQTVHMIWIN